MVKKDEVVVAGPKITAGRLRRHSGVPSSSGEGWREEVLLPALSSCDGKVIADLTGTTGGAGSWSEEAFGGAVRKLGPSVLNRIVVKGHPWQVESANQFMAEAAERYSED